MAKMVRRRCMLCPEENECAIMYISKEKKLAVHQDCLLYSSGFVESEDYNPENPDIRFDVDSVEEEIKRGKKLKCCFCHRKGATVGCEIKNCRRSYHYFCALCDDAARDEKQGIYRVFCPNHDPKRKSNIFDECNNRGRSPVFMKSSPTRKRTRKGLMTRENLQIFEKKHDRHRVRIAFLRKCKQAGLLDEIFKEMWEALHLAQKKLMDDNTSETEYEETVVSLFDCGLFENVLTTTHSGIEEKIQSLLNTRKELDTQIKLLEDLKEVTLPVSEDTTSVSNSISE